MASTAFGARRLTIAVGTVILAIAIMGWLTWEWYIRPWSIPHGFSATEFRTVDFSYPPQCDFGARSEPVPVNSRGLANLALLKAATASASSLLSGFPQRHVIKFLNDGWYNNCRSWVAASMPSWIEIDLSMVYEISLIKLGSEHRGSLGDRAPTVFTIALQKDRAGEWRTVVTYNADEKPIKRTTDFSFERQPAQFVRVNITATEQNDLPRIDEIEIYGRRLRER